ncbi:MULTISPECIES: endonuclease V [unclassified Flavobacterium]|uniref:endonuclease V n=1 Tax=unclassified Flavobacterium TaxID=196869 RepID=UPI003621AB91
MLVAVDVHYKESYAKTVLLLFENWQSEIPIEVIEVNIDHVEEYIPGAFYKRELPCITEALKKIDLEQVTLFIVDGYIYVDNKGGYGLGGHLYAALGERIPVVGVAKTQFQANKETVVEVFRGESKNPLYVSAIGMDKEWVAEQVQSMHGEFRLPYLLKLMDTKTKEE